MLALPRFVGVIPALLAVVLIAACETPPGRDFERLTYAHLDSIHLDVADIVVAQEYEPPMEPPYVEHRFPVRPADAARQWANDRLRAVGDSGTATFTVHEASVEEVEVDRTEGWQSLFVTEPAERYEARLNVSIAVERGGENARISVTGERSTSVQENATVNEREQAWYDLVRNLMQDVSDRLDQSIRENFSDYLRGPIG